MTKRAQSAGGSGIVSEPALLAASGDPLTDKPRVLVVDDEESVLVTIQAILEMDGYAVDGALTGKDAIQHIRSLEYDLVLTDLRLADMSGQEILAELRRRSPDTVAIMLTGYASLESAVAALREGAYDYLIKPSDAEELRATVRRGLERRALGRALRERIGELEEANRTISELNADLERRIAVATAELRETVVKLEEADRLKSQFLSIASHELKTPITAMSGFVQIALRRLRTRLQPGSPSGQEWEQEATNVVRQLEIVQRQTDRLARLTDELLDVSRIQSGRLEFRFEDVDLVALAQQVVDHLAATTSHHALRVIGTGGAASTVWGDSDHLEQVVSNLVANAIKYSPEGGQVDVTVAAEPSEVHVAVRDEGIGVPSEQLDRIFELFYRAPDRRAENAGGMGLGLYISKAIVERHGGRIWAESGAARGTTVHVVLPRWPAEAGSAPRPAEPAEASRTRT